MEVKINDQDEDNTFSSSDANGKVLLGQHQNSNDEAKEVTAHHLFVLFLKIHLAI